MVFVTFLGGRGENRFWDGSCPPVSPWLINLERRSMPINEELISTRVPVSPAPARMSKQRVREPVQRPQLSLIALSADINDDSLTAGRDAVMRNVHIHGRVVEGRWSRSIGDFRWSQRRLKAGELEVLDGAGTDLRTLVLTAYIPHRTKRYIQH